MLEIAFIIAGKAIQDIDILSRALSRQNRPDFDDDLPKNYRWLFNIIDVLPFPQEQDTSKSGNLLFVFWQNEAFDVSRVANQLTNYQFKVLGYFSRHYEDWGGEDDPELNGVRKLLVDGMYVDLVTAEYEECLSTQENISLLKAATGF